VSDKTDPDAQRGRTPSTALTIYGTVVLVLSAVVVGEHIYEQTVLTWRQGPQMIGFSMVHLHPIFVILGSVGILLLHIWLALFVFKSILRLLIRRTWMDRQRRIFAVASAVLLGLLYIPYPWWTSLTLWVAGPGPFAQDQLTSAAIEDRQGLVDMLLSRGVAIDGKNGQNDTALEATCRNHHQPMAIHLVERGAALDAAPSCRQYPDFAVRMKPDLDTIQSGGLPEVPGTTIEVHSSSGSQIP
jgi:hypothetical protein